MLAILEEQNNGALLIAYLTAIGNLYANLHRTYVKEIVERLKPIVHKHLIDDSEATTKVLTKDKC